MLHHITRIISLLLVTVAQCDVTGDARDNMFNSELVPLHEVQHTEDGDIHLLVTAIIRGDTGNQASVAANLETFVSSLLLHSEGTSLHIMIFTDQASRPIIQHKIKQIAGRRIANLVISNYFVPPCIFPKLKIEFVSLQNLTDSYRKQIDKERFMFNINVCKIVDISKILNSLILNKLLDERHTYRANRST